MSLTSFISIPRIRERLRGEFPVKVAIEKQEAVARPRTRNYTIVGTAFDYLFRFLVEHQNAGCNKQRWVAEIAVEQLPVLTNDRRIIQDHQIKLSQAKSEYETYMATGVLSDELIRNAIILAQLDFVFRGHKLNPTLGQVNDDDVADLRSLLETIPRDRFVAKQLCILNPTFGDVIERIHNKPARIPRCLGSASGLICSRTRAEDRYTRYRLIRIFCIFCLAAPYFISVFSWSVPKRKSFNGEIGLVVDDTIGKSLQ